MYIILVIVALICFAIFALFKNIPNLEEEEKEQKIVYPEFRTLPHCLFYGPAGLGKTTLGNVVQKECSKIYGTVTNFSIYTPSGLTSQSEIYNLIKNIQYGDFVFIDEIHGLDLQIEESLYSVMQDFQYFYNGETIKVPKFTLIGATTIAGRISKPMRDRFTILIELDHMKAEDLVDIGDAPCSFDTYKGQESAKQLLKMHIFSLTKERVPLIDDEIKKSVADLSLGNPRVYKQFINHIIAFQTLAQIKISNQNLNELMSLLGVDELGLNKSDRRVIDYLKNSKKPVGEAALATAAGISKDDLLSIVEPKLEYLGFLTRTSRGRELSEKANKIFRSL